MKSPFRSAAFIAGTLVFLVVIFLGIRHFQSEVPAPRLIKNDSGTASGTAQAVSGNKTVEKKRVNVQFKDGNQLISYRNVPLYSVEKSEDKTVSITADGNLVHELVEKLPPPEAHADPEPAVLTKAENVNFKKLLRGKPGTDIDKEKTLRAVEEAIRSFPEAATLTIEVYTKQIEGKESFVNKKNEMGFNTLIASFSTLHKDHIDDEGRNANLAIAAEKIDGLIIPPGGKFSFNKIVGPRTSKYGFKNAGVISQGRVVPGMGGGICQVSTTLYRAALQAGLTIEERHNHSIYDGIEYAQIGLDAAVAWGYKDFRFRNNLDIPILISAKAGSGSVQIELYAEKKPFESVVLETRNKQEHPFKTQVKVNKNLKKGEKKIVHPGVTGYTVETYRTITKNGKSEEKRLSKDRYLTFNRIEEINN
ncbi:MAG: hypothetical protein Kow0029_06570 [Candidatus Rifleibacteriota bacterium]